MGNYIEATVELLLKDLPSFITYKNIIREDDLFDKQTVMEVEIDSTIDYISVDLDLLFPHSAWYCGEELHYTKETFYETYSYPKELIDEADYFLRLRLCGKGYEAKNNYLNLIEEIKPYLINNHPNTLGMCRDEDGRKENNFTIFLDENEFKQIVEENHIL